MKPMKSMIQALATLLLLGIVLTGCSEDLWFQDGNAKEGTYTMTVQASMCSEGTRALSLGTSTINASWAEGETVTVYNVTRSAELSGTLVAKSSGTSTTLKGQLTGTIVAGGSSWGETTNGKGYSTTAGGATAGGNGKAVITWYGTTYPT